MAHDDVKRALSESQRTALRLMWHAYPYGPGICVTSQETFADRYNVWIHWHTAEALERRGLVTIGEYDEEGSDVWITEKGLEVAS